MIAPLDGPPRIPPLEPETPPCSVCGKSTTVEDGETFICEDCRLVWPVDDWNAEGDLYDPDEDTRCLSTVVTAHTHLGTGVEHASTHRCSKAARHTESTDPSVTRHAENSWNSWSLPLPAIDAEMFTKDYRHTMRVVDPLLTSAERAASAGGAR